MDFSFSDEQDLLRDSIRKYLSAKYDAPARMRIVASADGYSRECWQQFAELGLVAASSSPRNTAGSAVVPSKQ